MLSAGERLCLEERGGGGDGVWVIRLILTSHTARCGMSPGVPLRNGRTSRASVYKLRVPLADGVLVLGF